MAEELKTIQPTQVDLESYYKANPEPYRQPESLRAVLIPLAADEDPEPLLAKVTSADDFRKLATERLPENSPQDAERRQIVRGRSDPQFGPTDALFALAEGEWTKTPHTRGDRRWLAVIRK